MHKFLCRSALLAGGWLLMSLTGCASSPPLRVVDLRCQDKPSPMGIDILRPQLSWRMESAARGEMQSSYRLLVATDPALLEQNRGDLWDSGDVATDQSINLQYAGQPLASRQVAYWKVQVRDQNGALAESLPSRWEMGLLQPADWSAQWIDFPPAHATTPATQPAPTTEMEGPRDRHGNPYNQPPCLRKTFTVSKPIAKARLYATALGFYDCWVNGNRAGNAVLAPDWTNYHHRVRYQTFDVTPDLHPGKNAIAALLGDGWYSGNVCWIGSRVYGPKPAFLAQLVIEYADGSRDVIATDQSWKGAVGPILLSDLQEGEHYDARQEIPNWNAADFDDSSWQPVSTRSDSPQLEAQIGPPVVVSQELTPVGIKKLPNGAFIVDFGQNMVGFTRLRASAPAGATVKLRFAEMLSPDGAIYTENLRKAHATDEYTFKGQGLETWQPSFTFHGFRYVEVTGLPGELTPSMLTGIVIGSDNERAGEWECSDPLLNKLYSNIIWGQRGNFISVPTDCPQRDERLGWMGDAQVFIRTAAWNFDVHQFFDNWLVEVADAQEKDGAFTDVSPHVAAGAGVAAWADAGVICPWTIYEVYGDRQILERQYPSMAKYIEYLKANSDHLIRPAKGYGDWLSIAADTPKDVLATAFFAHDADLMSRIADIIGKPDDAAQYRRLFHDVRTAFNSAFVEKSGQIKGHTQTCYLLGLRFDLLDPANQALAVKYLLADIAAKKDHLSTGFVGVSFLLPTLTRFGEIATAYRLIDQDTFPSWLFPVKNGATTIWERWDGWTPDHGFQDPAMNSFNHYSLGSCGQWMYDTVAGIGMDSQLPAFKQIIIRPRIGGNLTSAKASYRSPYGPISSEWKITGTTFTLNTAIPPNTQATVFVPAAQNAEVMEGNNSAANSPGVTFVRWENGAAIYKVGAGRYAFTSQIF